jgi:hypothetical protein
VLNQVDVERGVFASGDPDAYRRLADRYYSGTSKSSRIPGLRLRREAAGTREAA